MKTDLSLFNGSFFVRSNGESKKVHRISDRITAIPTENLMTGHICQAGSSRAHEIFFLRERRIVSISQELTIHRLGYEKGPERKNGHILSPGMIPISCWKSLTPRDLSYPLKSGLNEHSKIVTGKLVNLMNVLLPCDRFSAEEEVDFNHWNVTCKTLPNGSHFARTRINASLQVISMFLEDEVYEKFPRNDQRVELLGLLRNNTSESLELDKRQRDIICHLLDNALNVERDLFALSNNEKVKDAISYHHDELLGYLVPPALCDIGRNSISMLPKNSNVIDALNYCLQAPDPGFEIKSILCIMGILGYGTDFSSYSEVYLSIRKGEFSTVALGVLISQSVVECQTAAERDDVIGFLSSNAIKATTIFSTLDNLKGILQELKRAWSIAFYPRDKQMVVKCHMQKIQRNDEICKILKSLNAQLFRINNNMLLSEYRKQIDTRREVIIAVRRILFIQPFAKGNFEMAVMLHILFCRIANLAYVKFNIYDYLSYSAEEMLEKEKSWLEKAEQAEHFIEPAQANPIIPFVINKCSPVLRLLKKLSI